MRASDFSGKCALITGASKGIGHAIAERFASDGADVAMVARSAEDLRQSATAIAALHNVSAYAIPGDLSTETGCRAVAEAAVADLGGLDILVNCAGATRAGTFPQQPDEDWIDGFALKFFGAVRLARALWPELTARRGTVINIGGGAALTPAAGFMVGGAVNAALAHFSKALSKQGLVDDVNVNVVHPGMTVSSRLEDLLRQQADAEGATVDEIRARNVAAAGTRRLGEPEDIAEVVAFLCSPWARHVQGVSLVVDGGATPGI